jgi:hypothetical protein
LWPHDVLSSLSGPPAYRRLHFSFSERRARCNCGLYLGLRNSGRYVNCPKGRWHAFWPATSASAAAFRGLGLSALLARRDHPARRAPAFGKIRLRRKAAASH